MVIDVSPAKLIVIHVTLYGFKIHHRKVLVGGVPGQ